MSFKKSENWKWKNWDISWSSTKQSSNNSDLNIYIQSVKLNGENYNYSYITHKDIMKGGELVFEMGSIPNKSFANDKEFRPKSKMY